MNLTKYERETILNFNEGDRDASVYTHNRPMMRKLEKLAKDHPGECRLYKTTHDGQAKEFYVPKSWIRIIPPRKSVVLTKEQKQQRRELLEQVRKAKVG